CSMADAEVRKIMGISLVSGASCNRRHTANPSICDMCTSSRIRSGRSAWTRWTAWRGSVITERRIPADRIRFDNGLSASGQSSMIRTWISWAGADWLIDTACPCYLRTLALPWLVEFLRRVGYLAQGTANQAQQSIGPSWLQDADVECQVL